MQEFRAARRRLPRCCPEQKERCCRTFSYGGAERASVPTPSSPRSGDGWRVLRPNPGPGATVLEPEEATTPARHPIGVCTFSARGTSFGKTACPATTCAATATHRRSPSSSPTACPPLPASASRYSHPPSIHETQTLLPGSNGLQVLRAARRALPSPRSMPRAPKGLELLCPATNRLWRSSSPGNRASNLSWLSRR